MTDLLTAAIRDPTRLAALSETALLDTGAVDAFDRLTRLVCRVLATPVALVALVAEDRQYFKSHVGLPEPFASTRQTPLTHSFCKHVVLTDEPLVVPHAREHPELKDNPAILALRVEAYLGLPLRTPEGLVLGTLCAIDHEPREWTEEDIKVMSDLAASVMTEIELRVAVREAREQERARTALLESTGEGIYGIDMEGRCTFLNRAACQLLGYSPEEVLGENMHALIHHSHSDGRPYSEAECPIFRAVQKGEGVRVVDGALWRKDGTSFRAQYSSFPISQEGSIRGAVVAFTDVTERRRSEEEARRTATQLDAVLRQLAEGVIFTDAEGRILFVNAAAKAIHGVAELGVPIEQYTERYRLLTLEGEPYPPEKLPLARAVLQGETVEGAEWRVRRPDGTEVLAQGSAAPVRAADGTRLGAVLTIRDVTEARRAEKERERLLRAEREAHERVTAILESITDAFFALDRDWRFTYVNREAERVLQRPREELLGRNLWAEFPEARGSRFHQEYSRALVEQRTARFEEFYPPLNAWVEVRAYPSREGLSVYFRDVTDRKRAEEQRRQLLVREREARAEAERRAREEAALRHAAEAVAKVFTIEEVIAEIARSATAAVEADAVLVERIDAGASAVEVVAITGPGAAAVGSRSPYRGSLAERVMERGQPEVIASLSELDPGILGPIAGAWPDGSAVVIPLHNTGEAIGALVLVRSGARGQFAPNEVERARTFAGLAGLAFRKVQLLRDSNNKREELGRVLESRSRLMRGFTHDVKNPLGAADGQLQMLEMGVKGALAPDQRDSIRRTRASLRRALELIDTLVDLARAEAAEFTIQRQPVDLREIAHEMTRDYRAAAEANRLHLAEVHLPGEMPVIHNDPARIRQILDNLLSNAVKYTDEGGITVRVGTWTETYPDWITVEVADTGPGIAEDQLPRLFREFSRVTSSGKHGAGLGLAISQRIAEALGGRITVESQEGRGSTFTLWLPLA